MQQSFTNQELLDCGHGQMFGPGNAQLPLPPMLMFDRIVHISDEGGEYGKGEIVAELDLNPDIEPADLQSGNASSAQYLLQVGSFRQQADADRRRGELALLGLEATVEPGNGDNGRWYRVYLGPFENRSEMARARSLTAQADMDTLLLKRESP